MIMKCAYCLRDQRCCSARVCRVTASGADLCYTSPRASFVGVFRQSKEYYHVFLAGAEREKERERDDRDFVCETLKSNRVHDRNTVSYSVILFQHLNL